MPEIQKIYSFLIEWSEIWAVLIPLFILCVRPKKENFLQVVIVYLLITLVINICAGLIWVYNKHDLSNASTRLPSFLRRNNYLYNLRSIIKVILFVLFFQMVNSNLKWFNARWIITVYVIATIINFCFLEDFFYFSSRWFAVEGIILLICCVSFFLQRLQDEELYLDFDAPLIIITGLTIHEGISFFIFLFYNILMQKEKTFAINIWDVHNISYIIFCAFTAYAFYGRSKAIAKSFA